MKKICFFCLVAFLFCSCQPAPQKTEAELSAFGAFVYELDTLQMEHHLQAVLRADTSSWKAHIVVRKRYEDIAQFEDTPLWFSRLGVTPEADSMLAVLRRELPVNGLDTTAFLLPQIARDLEIVHRLAFDSLCVSINEVLPRLDYNLSCTFVHYCAGQRYGFLRPDKLLNKLDYKIGSTDYARLFDYEVTAPDYDEALQQLSSDERIQYLRDSHPTGPVYEALRAAIDTVRDNAQRRTLAVNIERCRWQMTQPATDGRRIVVNLAAQQLWAFGTDSILNMKICCGSTLTKTPLLHSGITHLQVNPEWIIPQNIIKNEVTHHAGDSSYFARNHYYIIERSTGDTLRPSTVTAAQMLTGRFRIAQFGGAGNSLGRLVFRFPNDFAVYLHDTNNPSAFRRERRTLSHGCIRVQRPFDLACFLLPDADEWTIDRLRLSIDLPPETDRGRDFLRDLRKQEQQGQPRQRPLRLLTYHDVTPHVPLFIIYFTAYPNPESNLLEFFPDIYNYDRLLLRSGAGVFVH
ncbi:MAG: L,D-transpeptidase family protein [Bacteroidaceae bacterium]|nr:L,D-transpeptidase family protein [Bacteroidaceae bacterium]